MSELSSIVIGIGNSLRNDDGVGLRVAHMIGDMAIKGVSVVEGIGDGYSLVDIWSKHDRAIVIDCTVSGNTPGKLFRFDALREEIPADLFNGYSTHSISVAEALELGKVLGKIPKNLIIYGIEGKDLSPGEILTPEVEDSAHRAVELIVEELTGTER